MRKYQILWPSDLSEVPRFDYRWPNSKWTDPKLPRITKRRRNVANIKVSIINESTVLTDQQVSAAVPAFQTQVSRDFAKAWGIDADLTFVSAGLQPDAGSWWLVVLDDSDQAGVLGY